MNKLKSVKIFILTMLVITLLFGIESKVEAASSAEISLSTSGKLVEGKTIQVTIALSSFSDNDEIKGVSKSDLFKKEIAIGKIGYDTEVFDEITIENIKPAANWKISTSNSGEYILENNTGNFGTGTIATLNLTVKKGFTAATTTVTCENVYSINYYEGADNEKSGPKVQIGNKSVTIVKEEPVETPSATPSVTPSATPSVTPSVTPSTTPSPTPSVTPKPETKKISSATANTPIPHAGEIGTILSIATAIVLVVTAGLMVRCRHLDKKVNKDFHDEDK